MQITERPEAASIGANERIRTDPAALGADRCATTIQPSGQQHVAPLERTGNRTIYNTMHRTEDFHRTMAHITANDLKTRGIAAIEASLAGGRTEAVVSVRGADRYVVMDLAHYQHLRECELEAALAESRADIAAGRFVAESAAQHVARLQALVAGEGKAASTAASKRKPAAAAAVTVARKRPPRAPGGQGKQETSR
ncbi:MAG TPA: hypothetical protein PLB41_12495 [Rubrivivax sp.]|nr:hypothetical protein [Rubrivivax sp.]HPO19562.1 hypothetical protein [Rubrivivax sp.]